MLYSIYWSLNLSTWIVFNQITSQTVQKKNKLDTNLLLSHFEQVFIVEYLSIFLFYMTSFQSIGHYGDTQYGMGQHSQSFIYILRNSH